MDHVHGASQAEPAGRVGTSERRWPSTWRRTAAGR